MNTRRETLRRAAGIGAAMLLPALLRPAGARGQAPEDEDLQEFLEQAIELEQASVLAYDTAVESPAVDAALKGTLELLRDQEQAHANAWRSAIDSLGFDAPEPPSSPTDETAFALTAEVDEQMAAELEKSLAELQGLDRPDELLGFLTRFEERLLARYLDLAPELESVDLARTSAEVAASHAQHLVAVAGALGDEPVRTLERLPHA